MSVASGLEPWSEAVRTLLRHRGRSTITALSMSWGLFMLVVLLGAASGMARGSEHMLGDDAKNSLWIYPGETTLPHRGTTVGTPILFDTDDIEALQRAIPEIEHISGRLHLRDETTVTRGERRAFFEVRSVHADHVVIEPTRMTAGRFLHELDVTGRRKVVVIGSEVATRLFDDRRPIGESIEIGGVPYDVVGVFTDDGGEGDERLIYLPISTAQLVFGLGQRVHMIMFTVPIDLTVAQSQRVAENARRLLAARHGAADDDPGAVRIDNSIEAAAQVRGVITAIIAFTWLVGFGTVFAGAVGVGNIMLISVAERTHELGVRRAIGATGANIVAMVLRESLVLTAIAGYGGLLAGLAVIHVVAPLVPASDVFRDPAADPTAVLVANVVLLAAGLLAGAVPAHRAARIDPIEALRA